ncbi:hypothetical protein SADUNF_Sadunf02G0175500 [Salix dunnii]|uniref:SAWADEE domain-containing protein n=1 Tax=Salix dunnii TaxID=1413687 RepID=A0A835TIN8_9ROSI|nr:hypothetical protein SADUNF_Sadunf02G0175500 [Salix dunnii]
MSVANPNAASVPPPSDYDVEFRSLADDAWYSVCTVLDGEKLTLKYQNFSDDEDSIFEVKNLKTLDELEKLKDRFRPISPQLQDNECHKVVRGVVVCVSHSFDGSDNRFYDAIVDDSTKCAEQSPCKKRPPDDDDLGGYSSVLLIDNLDKNLSPSTIVEFIHSHTSLSVQACVFPSMSSEMYTQGAIVLNCRKNLEKLSKFLDCQNHIITSKRGRPWVEYTTAKQLRDLFMEFTEHQRGLHRRLAMEEREILQPSQAADPRRSLLSTFRALHSASTPSPLSKTAAAPMPDPANIAAPPRSISLSSSPAACTAAGIATAGPTPITAGSTPTAAKLLIKQYAHSQRKIQNVEKNIETVPVSLPAELGFTLGLTLGTPLMLFTVMHSNPAAIPALKIQMKF